jgi:hypothetical protein
LGEVKIVWDSFNAFLKEDYPALSTEWRYYNDGKSWLCKIIKKKKTVCWVSVYENMFKTTFYFPIRAEEFISGSDLKKQYIDQFITGKAYGKIKGITVDINKPEDLETTKTLIELKEKFK